MREKFRRVLTLIEVLESTADSTGCSEDLTVVSAEALGTLSDFVTNHCGEDELPELYRAQESTPQSRLTEALRNPRFRWRSIESLTRIARVSVDETRDMLAAIGAIRSQDEREVYRLA